MKIHCVGGGPAGLYFSILAKTADAGHDITVFERHRPDDTDGWGVVFSGRTCAELAKIEPRTWSRVIEELVAWDTIEIHAQGERLRTFGHSFCGVARDRFTSLLQQRAEALGVKLRFEAPVEDPDALRDCDLLVGADGFASACRKRWEHAFEPCHDVGACRYIWLGTRKVFESFTFAFRENVHGVFQVHAYPFSREMSTFIVECHEDTWRRAGLDVAGEAYSAAYCAELFSDLLEGEPLLGNRSHWIAFDTLRNARWHHENVVLLGDAAHTAHFSIGSGTKLALEDAAALVASLRQHEGAPAALEAYERGRRPQVEKLQAAADHSRRWFETTDRRMRLPASELAFSLMGRVPKLGRGALAGRDEAFVARTEGAFARAYGAEDGTAPTRVPFRLGRLRLQGRIARGNGVSFDEAVRFVPFREGATRREDMASIARIDRSDYRDPLAMLDAVRRARAMGFDAVELWASPDQDVGPQLELLVAARDLFDGPVIARWDSTDGIELARSLVRAGIAAIHVPAANAEAIRLETGLPVIAAAPEWSDDEVATALLAGRADLIDRG